MKKQIANTLKITNKPLPSFLGKCRFKRDRRSVNTNGCCRFTLFSFPLLPLILILLLGITNAYCGGNPASEDFPDLGTESNPYTLSSWEELACLGRGEKVAVGTSTHNGVDCSDKGSWTLDKYYKLSADMDVMPLIDSNSNGMIDTTTVNFDTDGDGDTEDVGGFDGGGISNSYATGDISATSNSGGLVGKVSTEGRLRGKLLRG